MTPAALRPAPVSQAPPGSPAPRDNVPDLKLVSRLAARLRPWLAWPRALWVAVALGTLVALPGLGAGWFIDDYMHIAKVHGRLPLSGGPLDLFTFADGNSAHLLDNMRQGYPWWTLPDLAIAFFRPLSSLLHTLDHAVFGLRPVWHHLHSILWYAGTIAAAGLVLGRSVGPRIAGLALVLYAIDDAHGIPAVWVANRNSLIATALALFGMWAHLRWREDGWRPGLALSVLGLVLGLCGGETAAGVFALLFAYEALAAPGGVRNRLIGALPAAGIALIYGVAYRALGMGARGSGVYLDPLGEPWVFAQTALERVTMLVGGLIGGLPVELAMVAPATAIPLVLGSVAACAVFAWLLRDALAVLPDAERRHVRWLLAGSLLALVPFAATFPSGRLLIVPSLGGAVAVAVVLRRWLPSPERLRRGLAIGLLALHGLFAPVSFAVSAAALGLVAPPYEKAMRTAEVAAGRIAILPASPDLLVGTYTPLVLAAFDAPRPAQFWCLSMALVDIELRRTAPGALELRWLQGRALATPWEQLFRAHAHLPRLGEVLHLDGLDVEIVATDGEGFPVRAAFRFARDLDDPQYVFLRWHAGALEPFRLPPPGESMRIVREAGPLGI